MQTPYEIIAPEYAHNYINLVIQHEPGLLLLENGRAFLEFLHQIPISSVDYAYAENKWTVKEMLQHIIDAERVFSYRALWFARLDDQPLPGFDEKIWALNTDVSGRKWHDMIQEFEHTRRSTILMFESFDPDAWKAVGIANNNPTNVASLCYICAGHVAHHMNILKERYLGGS